MEREPVVTKEIDIFSNVPIEIKTREGEILNVLRPSFGQEIDMIKVISDVIGDHPELRDLMKKFQEEREKGEGEQPGFERIKELIQKFVEVVPGAASKVVGILIGKDEQFARDQLDSHDYLEMLVPVFFQKYLKWKEVWTKHKGNIQSEISVPSSGESVDSQ
jgi:hypothetical protein